MGKLTPSSSENDIAEGTAHLAYAPSLYKAYLSKNDDKPTVVRTANNIIATNLMLVEAKKPSLGDYDECVQAITNYFAFAGKNDVKPTISGIALALGTNRQAFLDACETGEVKQPVTGTCIILPNAVQQLFIALRDNYIAMMEGFMESGSIHPACGIFLLKNNAGYKEVVEQKHTVIRATIDADSLAEKYRQELESLD